MNGEFLEPTTWIALAGLVTYLAYKLISQYLAIKSEAVRVQRLRMQKVRAGTKKAPVAETVEHPDWLLDVLDKVGLASDILDSDEPPAELERYYPLIKGFLKGKLEKSDENSSTDEETFI